MTRGKSPLITIDDVSFTVHDSFSAMDYRWTGSVFGTLSPLIERGSIIRSFHFESL